MALRRITPYILSTLLGSIPGRSGATHQFGCEFRYERISGLTYELTVHFYEKVLSPTPSHTEVTIEFGDGSSNTVSYMTSTVLATPSFNVFLVTFMVQHTYPGPGSYFATVSDPNRNEGLLNVPNSVNVPLCVRAAIIISPLVGSNHSPIFTQPQTNSWSGLNGVIFHEPQVVDVDGDSLVCDLVPPLGLSCIPIANYIRPGQIGGAGVYDTLDATTGLYVWDHPIVPGEYVIAIRCREFRNGMLLGEVTRDMMLLVPPMVNGISDPQSGPCIQPRPTVSDGHFEIHIAGGTFDELRLIDAEGRILQRIEPSTSVVPIDLGNAAPGAYTILGIGKQGTSASRVMVVH